MKRKLLMLILVGVLLFSSETNAFAKVIEGEKNVTSEKYKIVVKGQVVDILQLAKDNDVDPDELKEAILAGPDADGRYSPFSHVRQLGTKSSKELASVEKKAPDGSPLFILKNENFAPPKNIAKEILTAPITKASYVFRQNQDTTAYNYTGNPGASGIMPYLGSFACHRYSNASPYIPYGKHIYLDRWIWLPDNYYHTDFVSNDTGTGRPNAWWVDIYYHKSYQAAQNYGVINLSYNQQL